MSERPEGTVRVEHIQAAVRERLDAKGYQPHLMARSAGEVIDTLVWETMVLLGEWQFVDLEVPPEAVPNKEGS